MVPRLTDRRTFLKAAGATFAASLSPAMASGLAVTPSVYASSYADKEGGYGAALLTEDGTIIASVPLPARGHDIAYHPTLGHALVFARRPGTIAVAFDRNKRMPPVSIVAAPGRHFYGHGAYSPDGRLLYASENDFDDAAGVIGVYNVAAGYERIGEFSSGGVGPHDILLLSDGRTLAVANGGIETHPDFGRAKLNLASMTPSLCFIDRLDGSVIERQSLASDLHQLSIRHLAVDGGSGVYFACQFEGSPSDHPPLCGHAVPGEAMRLFEWEPRLTAQLKNYIGSIAANPENGTVAITSPRGNCMMVLNGRTGHLIKQRYLDNVCGIAKGDGGFVASTGSGVLFNTGNGDVDTGSLRWDNHLLRISR